MSVSVYSQAKEQKGIFQFDVSEFLVPWDSCERKKTDQIKNSFETVKGDIISQLEYDKQADLIEKIKEESNIEILY